MDTLSERHGPVIQNVGLVDRMGRFLIGSSILGYFVSYYEMEHPSISLAWETGMVMAALYPLMTAMIGWDPLYAFLNARSCSSTGRHQYGTFPYQLRAIIGRVPKYFEDPEEHSLESYHDSPEARPRHPVWIVDKEPMIYPTDAQLDAYFVEQELKQIQPQHRLKPIGAPEAPEPEAQKPGGFKRAA